MLEPMPSVAPAVHETSEPREFPDFMEAAVFSIGAARRRGLVKRHHDKAPTLRAIHAGR